MRFLLAVLLPFYLLDQATKWLIVHHLAFGEERIVVPDFFTLVYWGNTGAAFSFLTGQSWLFIALALAALLFMAIAAWRGVLRTPLQKSTWSLLAAGILGNLTDRFLHGHVVDFLLFYLHLPFANPWPAFNVADSCICVATGLLIWQSFRTTEAATAQVQG